MKKKKEDEVYKLTFSFFLMISRFRKFIQNLLTNSLRGVNIGNMLGLEFKKLLELLVEWEVFTKNLSFSRTASGTLALIIEENKLYRETFGKLER